MRKLSFDIVDIEVGPGWKVTYNTLFNLDPESNDLTQEEFEHYSLGMFTQNLVQIESDWGLIDVGWYPDSDLEGSFRLRALKRLGESYDWQTPIKWFETRSLMGVWEKIMSLTKDKDI